jgi:hypothetical protein
MPDTSDYELPVTDLSKHTEQDATDVVNEMYYQRAQNDYKEVQENKRFYDTGTRIPGKQAGKNLDWERRVGTTNSVVEGFRK